MNDEITIEEINARLDAICAQRESFANEAAILRATLTVKTKLISDLQARIAVLEAEVAADKCKEA
jgi:hypothetical protein